jgi:hypothetical protein
VLGVAYDETSGNFDVMYKGPEISVSLNDCWPVYAIDAIEAYQKFKRRVEQLGHTLVEGEDG